MTFFPDAMSEIWQAILGGVLAYLMILIAVRLVGLRSFAKMAPHDFAITVAIGSVLASAALANTMPLLIPLTAIATLFILQFVVSTLLTKIPTFANMVLNDPVLLMDGPKILHEHLAKTKVSEDELRAKLREANVTHYDQVLAVVFETTGDVSVLHSNSNSELDQRLLEDVVKRLKT